MRKIFAMTSALLLATSLLAQEANQNDETQAPAEDAAAPAAAQNDEQAAPSTSAGQTRSATPQEITRAVHGSWQIKCVTTQPQQCLLYQLIVNDQNAPLLEYSLIPAKDETGGDVKMVATLITPLNTVLSRGIIFQVDQNDPVQQPYGWCAPIGCFARFGLTEAELDKYKAGTKISTALFMMQNPGQGIEIDLPLDGFGAAYDELMEIEAEQKAAAQ